MPVAKEGISLPVDSDQICLWHEPFVHVFLIIIVAFTVYFNTIATPFLFDDITYLVSNPAVKDFSFFTDSDRIFKLGILPDVKNNFVLRPVSYFTYAVNYAIHGLDVRGYHLTNLIIHIGNGLLVYLLVGLLLQAATMTAESRNEILTETYFKALFPLACALLFVCHPLQTQAVTYIIQRFTSLVALFYLTAVVMYAKSRLSPSRSGQAWWYFLALVAAVFAMGTKENAFTLPLALVLLEFMFFSGAVGKRLLGLIPFLSTLVIIPIRLSQLPAVTKPVEAGVIRDSINMVNFSGVSSWHYLMTQFGVIVTYLRLLVLPIRQNFDYDYRLQTDFFSPAVLLPLILLLFIIGAGIYLCFRSRRPEQPQAPLYRLAAFGIFWFFLALAMESSIIPIDDLIFEHRAYLPSIGFFLSFLALAVALYSRRYKRSIFASKGTNLVLALIIVTLSIGGIVRNMVWKDKVSFWKDIAAKSPNKARVHYGLGSALLEQRSSQGGTLASRKGIEAAIDELRTAIRLRPDYLLAHVQLGKSLTDLGQYDEASTELLTAVQLNPESSIPHIFMGELHEKKGELDLAREAYAAAIAADPLHPEGHVRLGKLHAKEGDTAAAIAELEKAYQRYPDEGLLKQIRQLKEKR
nr:tetratricopeptide repeat protein [Geotalea sp. SG265]